MLCRGYHGLLANIYLNEFDQKMDRRGVYTRVHRNFLMKGILQRWNEWLRCRICIYIWKQWKNPKIRGQNLKKLGILAWQACQWGAGLGYCRVAGSVVLSHWLTNERFALAGYYNFPAQYEQLCNLHLCG